VSVEDVIAALRNDHEFMRDVVEWQRAPPRDARFAAWPAGLSRSVTDAFARRAITQPYAHQTAAIEATLRGEHVAVVASAAGGKSLCFHAPILHALAEEKQPRALCLFPTKALTQDQLATLLAQVEGLGLPVPATRLVAAYDGDTPQAKRAEIRKDARVIVTNADMLHIGILPHHARWSAFFRNLRYVCISSSTT
jgi:DEAD/DEAH box helicase domain-containing protein